MPQRGEPTAEVIALGAALPPLFAAHAEVAAVYVFGSVARGSARPDSDLDLGVVFRRRGDSALDHAELIARLAYEIGKRTGESAST